MPEIVKRFALNGAGRDFVVGDIHGCFTRLNGALQAVEFNPDTDRLFSVGDLVDRGPESESVLDWIAKPWFHAVRGNHEQMTIDSYEDEGRSSQLHMMNGGNWFYGMPTLEQANYAALLADLPLIIEIETAKGLIGIVHADCPRKNWPRLIADLQAGGPEAEHLQAACQWSRSRITDNDTSIIEGVDFVIAGHTPITKPAVLGNVAYIDTMGWRNGLFTLLNLTDRQFTCA